MKTIKRVLRFTLIFLGIISLVPLCYLIYVFWTQNSWRVLPAGDGQTSAITWLDSNANGVKDSDENYLPHVCLWSSDSLASGIAGLSSCENNYTDSQGGWGEFLPGGSCNEVFVFAQPPSGFHPTTDLVSNGCDVKFGFVQDNIPVNHKVLNIAEYIQQRNRVIALEQTVIGLIIIVSAIVGTIWLEKRIRKNQ